MSIQYLDKAGLSRLWSEIRARFYEKPLKFTNTIVAMNAFAAATTYEDYPFRAAVALSGVTETMTPEVILGCAEATGGNFAPVAASYAGGVYLYAAEVPKAAITIPTIICWK